jgi:hypothetical protein
MKEKIVAIRNIMKTMDELSTIEQMSTNILRGKFSEVLTMFLRKDLNALIGDESELSCSKCSYAETEGEDKLLIIDHAMIILNRCLIPQVKSAIENTIDAFAVL